MSAHFNQEAGALVCPLSVPEGTHRLQIGLDWVDLVLYRSNGMGKKYGLLLFGVSYTLYPHKLALSPTDYDHLPRIDPLQLLKCLSVLLSPEGGIKSKDEVQRLARGQQHSCLLDEVDNRRFIFTHVQLKCGDVLVDSPASHAPFAGLGLPRVVQPSRFLETAYSNGTRKSIATLTKFRQGYEQWTFGLESINSDKNRGLEQCRVILVIILTRCELTRGTIRRPSIPWLVKPEK
uniref:Uncharacterized protein n=1 Tax=Timema douglasi TaxID=61478 RepID=A0A7R8VSS8_TIMDO|nr:unnamed protein product [Timema douglasi]